MIDVCYTCAVSSLQGSQLLAYKINGISLLQVCTYQQTEKLPILLLFSSPSFLLTPAASLPQLYVQLPKTQKIKI